MAAEAKPIEDLALNARGLLLAAAAPIDLIELLLGCTRAKAEAFQETAIVDFRRLLRAIEEAKAARA